jgi:sulfur-oxidizing protein SoxX
VNPLTSSPGDVVRGRAIVANRQVGLCLLCHSGPFPEERFQGNLAPDLTASVGQSTPAQLRARLVDPSRFNSISIMPAYYRSTGLNRVAPKFANQTILTGQEIEDVVAFLVSLQ